MNEKSCEQRMPRITHSTATDIVEFELCIEVYLSIWKQVTRELNASQNYEIFVTSTLHVQKNTSHAFLAFLATKIGSSMKIA